MKRNLRRILILVLGWAFLILGVIGLFLPVLQGILFILVGLLILSKESEVAALLLKKLETRFPDLHHKADRMRIRVKRGLKRGLVSLRRLSSTRRKGRES